jgi:hypothetical protein
VAINKPATAASSASNTLSLQRTILGYSPRALQDQYRALRAVLRAGRELAAAGRLHPDSEPSAYATSIRQWASLSSQLPSKVSSWCM